MLMNKSIRYRWIQQMFGSQRLLKAIAMLLLVRKRKGTTISHFSYNKLHDITGMHATTIRKNIDTLKEVGLIMMDKSGALTFRSIISRHSRRNARLSKIDFSNIKTIVRSLQAILFVNIQLRKDYAKRVIRKAHNGRNPKQVKAAQKLSRRYGWAHDYNEKGLSYEGIAKRMRVCKQTAEKIVNFAVSRKMVQKFCHYTYTYMKGIWYHYLEGYTYTTRNYAVKVQANTYEPAKVFVGALVG